MTTVGQVDRQAIYAGLIIKREATPISMALAQHAWSLIREAFAGVEPRTIHETLSFEAILRTVKHVRHACLSDARATQYMWQLAESFGFDPAEIVLDGLGMRAIPHNGHHSESAKFFYNAHRDTWFGNPQAQINVWIPLHDVSGNESFALYQECFTKPVANDSEIFDSDAFIRWRMSGAHTDYADPRTLADLSREPRTLSEGSMGSMVIFSGAHLHQTLNNDSGKTRYSLDFRIVHKADVDNGVGAPNVDNRAKGTTVALYKTRDVRG